MRPAALELLGVTHRELLTQTPGETFEMLEAAAGREERKNYRAAWVVSHLLNVHLRKGQRPITPNRLLGKATAKDYGWD